MVDLSWVVPAWEHIHKLETAATLIVASGDVHHVVRFVGHHAIKAAKHISAHATPIAGALIAARLPKPKAEWVDHSDLSRADIEGMSDV